MTQRLGFIGLGNLGVHLASSLVRAGFAVTVYDLNKEAATGLLATGATWTDSPQAVAEECDSVFTCLPSSRAVSMLKDALGTALRAPGFPAMLEG